jgi:transposase
VLEAVLWILNTGTQWYMLPQSSPNRKMVHRRFQHRCANAVLRAVLMDLANRLCESGAIDESGSLIDASFSMAKGGGAEIGPTRRVKCVNIMAIVYRHGLSLVVSAHAANHDEMTLVQLSFEFYMIEAKSENLISDKAHGGGPLDRQLRAEGIEMIAPHRSGRKLERRTQDDLRTRRYQWRWIVELFFAWLQWHCRLLVRWEHDLRSFLGFLQLAAMSILLKRFLR